MITNGAFTAEDLRVLLDSSAVAPRTREVLLERLAKPAVTDPRFFTAAQFTTLSAVCARLIPQSSEAQQVDLPGLLDDKMNNAEGKGWRYADLPPDAETLSRGLEGIDETSITGTGRPFSALPAAQQDEVLRTVQGGTARGPIWERLSAARFFEELLAALTELYYSHPLAKAQIGDVSFAEALGWVHIGLQQQQTAGPSGINPQFS